MHIDIISDTICPWCYIGKRQFERALGLFYDQVDDCEIDVTWRPFQLDPSTPKEGVDRKTYLAKKFGSGPQVKAAYQRIVDMGTETGIPFAFEKIAKTPNTLDSHRLIRWAGSSGCQDAVVNALFKAYFEDGKDIGDIDVLTSIAAETGMDAELVNRLFHEGADLDLIGKDDMLAREMGIQGVPTFIVDSKFPIGGAQDPNTILWFLMKAREKAMEAEAPQNK